MYRLYGYSIKEVTMISENMKLTNVCLPKEQHKKLKYLCLDLDISMAEFIREAISEKMKQCTLSTEGEKDK